MDRKARAQASPLVAQYENPPFENIQAQINTHSSIICMIVRSNVIWLRSVNNVDYMVFRSLMQHNIPTRPQ